MVDIDGWALAIQAQQALIQGRDGAVPLLQASCKPFPFVEHAIADSAYATNRVATTSRIIIEVVRKHPGQLGFAVHRRSWVFQRLFAWLGRNHRLAKDFETTVASAEAFLYVASAMLLVRRPERAK